MSYIWFSIGRVSLLNSINYIEPWNSMYSILFAVFDIYIRFLKRVIFISLISTTSMEIGLDKTLLSGNIHEYCYKAYSFTHIPIYVRFIIVYIFLQVLFLSYVCSCKRIPHRIMIFWAKWFFIWYSWFLQCISVPAFSRQRQPVWQHFHFYCTCGLFP